MKSTGIVRKVDDLGRLVVPKELRRTLDIDIKDPVEFFIDGENIVIRKYEPSCKLCGNVDNVVSVDGVNICKECIEKIGKLNG